MAARDKWTPQAMAEPIKAPVALALEKPKPPPVTVEAIGLMQDKAGHWKAVRVLCDESCVVEATPADFKPIAVAESKKMLVGLWEKP
jgi:hypothetical protein